MTQKNGNQIFLWQWKNLNWEPKIELNDGLERTIKYFLETIKNKKLKRNKCK